MSRRKQVAVDSPPVETRLTAPMWLCGIVRTAKGYAVATAEISTEGEVLQFVIGNSQAFPEFVAIEHRREAARLSTKTLGLK